MMSRVERASVDPYDNLGLRRIAARIIPNFLRRAIIPNFLRRAKYVLEDVAFPITAQPPRRLRLSISPAWFDFRSTGRDQLEFFVELAGLLPSDRVLDVACGVGRIALPLKSFLNNQGTYEGFDTQVSAIDVCKRRISNLDSLFNFTFANVKTDYQNPSGVNAASYSFKYKDGEFDFIYAGSIFTHLTKEEAANYLKEIKRVAKPSARI